MTEQLEDCFANGTFWQLYSDLEHQFMEFLSYVPYEGNQRVYSYKLLNLILSTGGHVDSALKEMARSSRFSSNPECQQIVTRLQKSDERKEKGDPPITIPIHLSLKAFEREYNLSRKKVTFKNLPEIIVVTPFEVSNPKTNAPRWWDVYNGLKHDVGVNIRSADLETALEALAGAFLLNVIYEPAILLLYDVDLLQFRLPREARRDVEFEISRYMLESMIEKTGAQFTGIVDTDLFEYEYD
jgi:hypothetical protein